MIRLAIVEDDKEYASILKEYADKYAKENNIALKIDLFSDGTEIAEDYHPVWDLIFLDVEMPHMNGIAAAKVIRKMDQTVLIMFITNMAQFAIKGYEVDALDYVLKPLNYPVFSMKFRKAVRILESRPTASIVLSVSGDPLKLDISDIRYVEVFDHNLVYHTVDGDYQTLDSLGKLESVLPDSFVRCNRSYLVNLQYVDGVKDNYVLIGQDKLKIGRTRKTEFMQKLSDFFKYGGR